jgi:hypothetical protein
MPKILFLKTTPKCIFPYKYCLIILKKMLTGFGTSITGKPVDHEKNKKFYMSQMYLATRNRKPFVDIWYGLREK